MKLPYAKFKLKNITYICIPSNKCFEMFIRSNGSPCMRINNLPLPLLFFTSFSFFLFLFSPSPQQNRNPFQLPKYQCKESGIIYSGSRSDVLENSNSGVRSYPEPYTISERNSNILTHQNHVCLTLLSHRKMSHQEWLYGAGLGFASSPESDGIQNHNAAHVEDRKISEICCINTQFTFWFSKWNEA